MYSYAKNTCPNAEYASEHILSLPMHIRMTHDDVKYIAEKVKKYAQ